MVASLSRQQIRIIKEKIGKEGVSTAELAEDLLDHLCTCIEEEMEGGLSFEEAFEKVFDSLEEDELKLTEMKTQELLEGKKAYYPDLYQSFGLMVLFVLGSVLIIAFAIALGGDELFKEKMLADYYPLFVIITNLIIFGAVIAYAVREIRQTQWKAPVFSFQQVPIYVYPVVLCIALLSQFWMEPLAMLSVAPREVMLKNAEPLLKHGLLAIIMVITVNCILAELLFRGIILKGLLKTMTPIKAIFWSSLFFIAVNFMVPVFMFTLGLMLGWLYWNTKSLYPSIFMLIFGTVAGYGTLFFMGRWEELFSWQEWFGNLWLYAGVIITSLLLTLGLFYYLHKKLSGQN